MDQNLMVLQFPSRIRSVYEITLRRRMSYGWHSNLFKTMMNFSGIPGVVFIIKKMLGHRSILRNHLLFNLMYPNLGEGIGSYVFGNEVSILEQLLGSTLNILVLAGRYNQGGLI